MVLRTPELRRLAPPSLDISAPILAALHLLTFINFFNIHMLSQRTARAISRHIPNRCCSHLPCVILRLEALFRPIDPPRPHNAQTRSSSSSTRWKSRQGRDSYAREAKVQGLKSRAAFKLLEVLPPPYCQSPAADEVRLMPSTRFLRRGRL